MNSYDYFIYEFICFMNSYMNSYVPWIHIWIRVYQGTRWCFGKVLACINGLKLGTSLEDSAHTSKTQIWWSAHGLKWSDFGKTKVYADPILVCSRFLCIAIGYCSKVILSKHRFKYKASNISVAPECFLTQISQSSTPTFKMSLSWVQGFLTLFIQIVR